MSCEREKLGLVLPFRVIFSSIFLLGERLGMFLLVLTKLNLSREGENKMPSDLNTQPETPGSDSQSVPGGPAA